MVGSLVYALTQGSREQKVVKRIDDTSNLHAVASPIIGLQYICG